MDVVSWDKLELREAISKELSVKDVIFSSPHSRSEDLQKEILMFCVKPQILSVDGQDFFKLFKINDNKIKILRSARKQVDTFNNIKISFDKQRLHFDKKDEPDLLFEFQAYMTDLITKAQKDMSEENEEKRGHSATNVMTSSNDYSLSALTGVEEPAKRVHRPGQAPIHHRSTLPPG